MAFIVAVQVGDQLKLLRTLELLGFIGDILARVRWKLLPVDKKLIDPRSDRAKSAADAGVNDGSIVFFTSVLHAWGCEVGMRMLLAIR